MHAPPRRRPSRRLPALALALLLALLGAPAAAGATGPEPVDVVLVTFDCASGNFICHPFTQAVRRTRADGRIVSPDGREDLVGTLSLLAAQGHDLIITDFQFPPELAEVAPRFPRTAFALFDAPLSEVEGSPPNVTAIVVRPREAAYLAGWLAARMERRRPGPDVVGAVGGMPIPPVDEFIVGYAAGARHASPGVRVLTGYSGDFLDPTRCAAVARRQIARGAGVVFDVAGRCGPGTLEAARRAGVWAIGVDADRAGLGPHILTSVVKRYDRGLATLIRQSRAGRLALGRTTVIGLREGGAGLGRISPRVPAGMVRELAAVRRRLVSGDIRVPGPAIP
jgi:basic membrane protein A and related proteins